MQKTVVIPAYQPDEKLIALVRGISRKGWELLVVDDGSGEKYAPVFMEIAPYARVISYLPNRGKGRALKEAFALLREEGKTGVIAVMDADGQHKAADAEKLLLAAEEDPGALFLGSRRQSGASPLKSRVGNFLTRLVFRLVSGVRVYDTQTGLRAFSSDLLPSLLAVEGERYEYEMNVLLTFAEEGIPLREIPIETVYLEGNKSSHFRAVRDSVRIYKEILKFSGASLISFCADYLLFALFTLASGGAFPVAANILARILSASLNFLLNRKLVFRAKNRAGESAARYALLAVGILALNSLLIFLLTSLLGVPALLSKLLTEAALFLLSFLFQRRFVFRKTGKGVEKLA